MSVLAASGSHPRQAAWLRVGYAVFAIAAAACLLGGLGWLLGSSAAPAPLRSPFGIGFREASPSDTGLGAWLLAVQSSLSGSLRGAVVALKQGGGWAGFLGIGFAYGVFHAAGPGHGKAVIAGYLVAGERALTRGFALSAAAALLQACVAILIVGIGALLLHATAASMNRAGTLIETASFALVALLGAGLTWRKAGRLARVAEEPDRTGCGSECGHVHLADAQRLAQLGTWRERAAVVVAAGTRPCSGAVLILVFALSQGVFAAGIAATLAMAAGTALTTGALASLAVFAKRLALSLAARRGAGGAAILGGFELLAAAIVLVLGLTMLWGSTPGLAS